jgi:hypothetical protein
MKIQKQESMKYAAMMTYKGSKQQTKQSTESSAESTTLNGERGQNRFP